MVLTRKSICGIIGHLDGFLFRLERPDCADRSENLLAVYPGIVLGVQEYRGGNPCALVSDAVPSNYAFGFLLANFNVGHNPLELFLVRQRTKHSCGVQRIVLWPHTLGRTFETSIDGFDELGRQIFLDEGSCLGCSRRLAFGLKLLKTHLLTNTNLA